MSRIKLRWAALAAAAALCAGGAGAALAASYTWIGASVSNDYWDTCANWIVGQPGVPCYPSADTDDALISGTFDVDLINETIDGLTVGGTVNFGNVSGTPTLNVHSITISGGAGGSVVTISSATISTW